MDTLELNFYDVYARRFDGLTQDELIFCIKEQYKICQGRYPDLENPKTFTEKLAWEKIHYRNPLMNICADKVKARDYFCEKIQDGEKYLVKQLGVYKSPDEIDFDKLPNQFVLKSNWGSGAQIIVKDKNQLNIEETKQKMAKWLEPSSNHYFHAFEFSYKNIEPRIVCEEILDFEYKLEFFCFNGEPKYFWIIQNDKTDNTKANFYKLDWTKMPLKHHYDNFEEKLEKPVFFGDMLEKARILSQGFPHVRVDFYKQKDGYKFSEMTFYTWAGLDKMDPMDYDLKIGEMMTLPKADI